MSIYKHLLESEKNIQGIINVAAPETLSKYNFLRRLAKTFRQKPHLIKPVSITTARMVAPRPANPSLNIDRLKKIIKIVPTINAGLAELKTDYNKIFSK
jgi:dTDP-4-dehydrorhamnose reductase